MVEDVFHKPHQYNDLSHIHPSQSIPMLAQNIIKKVLHTLSPMPDQVMQAATPDAAMLHASVLMNEVRTLVSEVILDKDHVTRLLLSALFSGNHVLLEDTPGVGKTTMAHAISTAMGLQFGRVQFTSDLMPSDITGTSIFDRTREDFKFIPGPVFSQILLADEINRASPKTQSALLEAMEERNVTVDGITHKLPHPFLVIATQNASHHIGTQGLPESQLDRFMLNIGMGYPSEKAQVQMLIGINPRQKLQNLKPALKAGDLAMIQEGISRVHVSEAIALYLCRIAHATRTSGEFKEGLSPRCLIGLSQVAKAWALLHGASFVTPDHIRAIYPWVAAHRLKTASQHGISLGPSSHDFHKAWVNKISSEFKTEPQNTP